jgi:hypothetical protein
LRRFGQPVPGKSQRAGAKSGPHDGCKIALSQSSFRSEQGATIRLASYSVSSGVVPVSSDLQAKLEKYERKAAQYKKSAEEATGEANRAFYQGLARYTDDLAAKFRQVIAKRSDTSLPAE